MIVLSGASASGKTEAAKMLTQKYGIVKAITTTTRRMRCNEVNGRDYFFVSKEQFEQMIKDDKFVEHTLLMATTMVPLRIKLLIINQLLLI